MLRRIGVAAICSANTMMLAVSLFQGFFSGIEEPYGSLLRWSSALLALPAVTYSALPFYRTAIGSLTLGALHIDLPISIAIVGAYCAGIVTLFQGGEYVYFDSVTALIFLLLVGRYVQKKAIHNARTSTMTAWDLFPAFARLHRGGTIVEASIGELSIGDKVDVAPAERIPSDGTIETGHSSVDSSLLTGESVPTAVGPGDDVLGGSMNVEGMIQIRITATGERTRFGRVVAALERAQQEKTPLENQANRLSGYFVFGVLTLASITFAVWHLIDPTRAFEHAIALLIVTCPCALGLAIPAAISVAMANAQKAGFYITKSEALETLSHVTHFYFDKTGTLTDGHLSVRDAVLEPMHAGIARTLAAHTAAHPVSKAVLDYCSSAEPRSAEKLAHFPGRGVQGISGIDTFRLGSLRWLRSCGVNVPQDLHRIIEGQLGSGYSVVLLACNLECCGVFAFSDALQPPARELIAGLRAAGKQVTILSGDLQPVVERIANELGIPRDQALGELLPEEKAEILSRDTAVTAMIGDGVNDAPAMRACSVGVGLQGGMEALLESVDVFVSQGRLQGFARLLSGAEFTRLTIRRNLCFSVCYNLFGAGAAMLGFVTPLTAAIIMPLSSLTVISSSILSNAFRVTTEKRSLWE